MSAAVVKRFPCLAKCIPRLSAPRQSLHVGTADGVSHAWDPSCGLSQGSRHDTVRPDLIFEHGHMAADTASLPTRHSFVILLHLNDDRVSLRGIVLFSMSSAEPALCAE